MTLEEEVGRLAESAGRGDAQREQELQAEIKHLKKLLKSSQIPEAAPDNDVPYVCLWGIMQMCQMNKLSCDLLWHFIHLLYKISFKKILKLW